MPSADVLEELWQEGDPKMLARRTEALKILRAQEQAASVALASQTELSTQAAARRAQDDRRIDELRNQLAEMTKGDNQVEQKNPAELAEQIFNFILKLAADADRDDNQINETIIAQLEQLYDAKNPNFPDVFDKLEKITQESASEYKVLPNEDTKMRVKSRLTTALDKLTEEGGANRA